MPIPPRTTTLTAAAVNGGVRIYTKTAYGTVHEACNTTTEQQLAQAIQNKNPGYLDIINHTKGWRLGDHSFEASPDSTLCSFAWATWSQSVFYQDNKGDIREWRHEKKWETTKFVQPNALLGTNIAAVHSPGAKRVVLFFQDAEGFICARAATEWKWEPAVRVAKATNATGIGATAWNDLKEIRLYFQNDKGVVCEYKGSFGSELKPANTGFDAEYKYEVGDITAVSWDNGAQIRIYLQDNESVVRELAYSGGKWEKGYFEQKALPNADIIAYVRSTGAQGFCLVVIWAGQDQNLYQSVWAHATSKWSEAHSIAKIHAVGETAGSWLGERYFVEQRPDKTALKEVTVYTLDAVVGLGLVYTNSKEQAFFGSKRGTKEVFTLDDHEDIITVRYAESADHKRVTGLRFYTSKQRTSQWYGTPGKANNVWTRGGYALAGFHGALGDALLGLGPVWSARMRGIAPEKLSTILKEADTFLSIVKAAREDFAGHEKKFKAYRAALDEGMKKPCLNAVKGIVNTARAIEYYGDLTAGIEKAKLGALEKRLADKEAQLRECKTLADEVEEAFRKICGFCDDKRSQGNEILGSIEKCLGTAKAAVGKLQVFYEEMSTTKAALAATEAKLREDLGWSETEKKNKEEEVTKHDKKVKDMRTKGIEGFDMDEAEEDLRTAEKQYQDRLGRQKKLEVELQNLQENQTQLKDSYDRAIALLGEIKTTNAALTALRDEDAAFGSAFERLSAVLAKIGRNSKSLDDNVTPQEFAEDLHAIVESVVQTPMLLGFFPVDGVDATLLQDTLQTIAKKA